MTQPSTVESEAAVLALTKALQVVSDPRAYADTAEGGHPAARAALAERAKAMTGLYLFQIEGLIRGLVRGREKGIVDMPSMVHVAWLRWLQLHGRRAGVVVPMDGWLVSEFPSELLSGDSQLLDRIGQANAIGCSHSGEIGISVPREFRTPSIELAETVGMADFSDEIGRLIGLKFGAEFDEPIDGNRSCPNSSVSRLANRLLRDLAAEIHGMRTGSAADYPGW